MMRTGDRPRDITRRATLTGLGATIALAPFGAAAAEDWSAVQAAALKEGSLSFYHNLRPQGVEELLAEFRKANPGIQTEQIRLGSAALLQKLMADR